MYLFSGSGPEKGLNINHTIRLDIKMQKTDGTLLATSHTQRQTTTTDNVPEVNHESAHAQIIIAVRCLSSLQVNCGENYHLTM